MSHHTPTQKTLIEKLRVYNEGGEYPALSYLVLHALGPCPTRTRMGREKQVRELMRNGTIIDLGTNPRGYALCLASMNPDDPANDWAQVLSQ